MPNLDIDGAQLFYKESGSGPPVLLIHGTGVDADIWGECYDDLAADHRVVAYDRRGHSRSRPAGPTGVWERHADDAAAFLEQLDLAPAAVVGWSGGGVVALKLAALRPDLLGRLVLVESAFDVPRNLTRSYVRNFLLAQMRFARGRDREAYEGFMRFVCERRGGINVWDDPDYPEERREVGRANAGAYRAEMAARRGLPTRKEAGEIRVPVTVVLGEQTNPWFERMALSLAKAIPHAELRRIPDANHAFGFTAPHELAQSIRTAVGAPEPVA